jgi:hypothetical protein
VEDDVVERLDADGEVVLVIHALQRRQSAAPAALVGRKTGEEAPNDAEDKMRRGRYGPISNLRVPTICPLKAALDGGTRRAA